MKIVTHCQLKNSHNLEIESYFVFGICIWYLYFVFGILRTSSPGDSISSDPERTVARRRVGRNQVR